MSQRRRTAPRGAPAGGRAPRAFVGVYFECCRTYARAYADPAGRFRARCPRCFRQAQVRKPEEPP